MTDSEFKELRKMDANHIMGRFRLITTFGADSSTVYMRDAVKEFTEAQLAEVSEIILRELQPVNRKPIVIDYTSRPPY